MKRRLYQLVAIVIAAMITQTSVLPQTPPELPDQFQKVKMLIPKDKKSETIKVTLRFEPDRLVIRPQREGDDRQFPYTGITSAEYSHSRHPRWKAGLGGAILLGLFTGGIGAVAGILGFFLKEKRHWLTIQTQADMAVLRLDKKNYEDILTKLDAKGITVETVEETKYSPPASDLKIHPIRAMGSTPSHSM